MSLRPWLLVAVAVALAIGVVVVRRHDGGPLGGRVDRVIDGDTFVLRLGGAEQRVRVIGIDTPEVAHYGLAAACYGDEARRFARTFLTGRTVRLVPGQQTHDRYGRLLAQVEVGGVDLSRELARRGLARALAIPPDTTDAPTIARLVAAARRTGVGLWSACGYAAAFPGK